jgi:hypothetical protein
VDLKVVLLDDHAGPHLVHQLVLGHQLAVAADQHHKDVERPLSERDRHAVRDQLAPALHEAKWAERVGAGLLGRLQSLG